MKGSEYLAARAAIVVVGMVAGGGIVAVTALWLVPLILVGLGALFPELVSSLGGVVFGLFVVVGVAYLVRRLVGLCLDRFEAWTIEKGGIEDL